MNKYVRSKYALLRVTGVSEQTGLGHPAVVSSVNLAVFRALQPLCDALVVAMKYEGGTCYGTGYAIFKKRPLETVLQKAVRSALDLDGHPMSTVQFEKPVLRSPAANFWQVASGGAGIEQFGDFPVSSHNAPAKPTLPKKSAPKKPDMELEKTINEELEKQRKNKRAAETRIEELEQDLASLNRLCSLYKRHKRVVLHVCRPETSAAPAEKENDPPTNPPETILETDEVIPATDSDTDDDEVIPSKRYRGVINGKGKQRADYYYRNVTGLDEDGAVPLFNFACGHKMEYGLIDWYDPFHDVSKWSREQCWEHARKIKNGEMSYFLQAWCTACEADA